VLTLGSAYFGARETQPWVVPVLRALAPWASRADLRLGHAIVRKLAHATEYGLLALLWLRAMRASGRASVRTAAWGALLICIACAFADEAHQSTLLNRSGSAADLVLDSVAALTVLTILRTRTEGARVLEAAGEVA